MNTKVEKIIYCLPTVELIKLDNEISLILLSGDPGDPSGFNPNASMIAAGYFENNLINDPLNFLELF